MALDDPVSMTFKEIPLKTKLYFLKWFWITLLYGLIIPTVCCIVKYALPLPQNIKNIIYIVFCPISISIVLYFCIKVLLGQKDRLSRYLRLYNLFYGNLSNIHKSILYEMQGTKCEETVVNQLCKDFNIEL